IGVDGDAERGRLLREDGGASGDHSRLRRRVIPRCAAVSADIDAREALDPAVEERRRVDARGCRWIDRNAPGGERQVSLEEGPLPSPIDALIEAAPLGRGVCRSVTPYGETVDPSTA